MDFGALANSLDPCNNSVCAHLCLTDKSTSDKNKKKERKTNERTNKQKKETKKERKKENSNNNHKDNHNVAQKFSEAWKQPINISQKHLPFKFSIVYATLDFKSRKQQTSKLVRVERKLTR